MNATMKIRALDKVARYAAINPTFETLDKCADLIDVLSNNPNAFWDGYFAMTGEDGPEIPPLEEMLAECEREIEAVLADLDREQATSQ